LNYQQITNRSRRIARFASAACRWIWQSVAGPGFALGMTAHDGLMATLCAEAVKSGRVREI